MTTISTTQMQPYNGEPVPDNGQYLVRYEAKHFEGTRRFKFNTAKFLNGKPHMVGGYLHSDVCKQITHIVKIIE